MPKPTAVYASLSETAESTRGISGQMELLFVLKRMSAMSAPQMLLAGLVGTETTEAPYQSELFTVGQEPDANTLAAALKLVVMRKLLGGNVVPKPFEVHAVVLLGATQ